MCTNEHFLARQLHLRQRRIELMYSTYSNVSYNISEDRRMHPSARPSDHRARKISFTLRFPYQAPPPPPPPSSREEPDRHWVLSLSLPLSLSLSLSPSLGEREEERGLELRRPLAEWLRPRGWERERERGRGGGGRWEDQGRERTWQLIYYYEGEREGDISLSPSLSYVTVHNTYVGRERVREIGRERMRKERAKIEKERGK